MFNGDVYDGTFDARNNYWGSASGPGGDGSGTGDSVYGVRARRQRQLVVGDGSARAASCSPRTRTSPVVAQDTAYWGLPAADGYKIQAEDFNEGGQGIAYNDTTTSNIGGLYRTTGRGHRGHQRRRRRVRRRAWTVAGEYLDYAVNLANGGTYQFDFRVADSAAGATFRVLVDGAQVGTDLAAPKTGGGADVGDRVDAGHLTDGRGAHGPRAVRHQLHRGHRAERQLVPVDPTRRRRDAHGLHRPLGDRQRLGRGRPRVGQP